MNCTLPANRRTRSKRMARRRSWTGAAAFMGSSFLALVLVACVAGSNGVAGASDTPGAPSTTSTTFDHVDHVHDQPNLV